MNTENFMIAYDTINTVLLWIGGSVLIGLAVFAVLALSIRFSAIYTAFIASMLPSLIIAGIVSENYGLDSDSVLITAFIFIFPALIYALYAIDRLAAQREQH